MANEKTYSAHEAALAVLAKAQELLAKSSIVKTEPMHKADSDFTNEGWSKTIDHGHKKHDELASHAKEHGAHGSSFSTWVGGHQSEHNFKSKEEAQGFQHSVKRRPEVKKTKLTSYNGGSLHSVRATLAHGPHEYKQSDKVDKSEDFDQFEELTKSAEFTSGFHTIEYFAPMNKGETGHEKGVHTGFGGRSTAGLTTQGVSETSGERKAGLKAGAVSEHKKVIGEMNSMPKPNLPKSEMLCSEHALGKKEGFEIVKSEHCVKCMTKSEFADLYEDLAKMEKYESEDPSKENEIGTKFKKDETENKEAPSNPMKPKVKEEQAPQRDAKNFETQPGKASAPADARQAETPTAQPPKEGVGERNMNPEPGSVPGKGIHKLSFFMGHRHNKRNGQKPPVNG